jgi:DMSO/TMAO reductase YedYZ molybdopterin-dependent catalytic subunit
MTSRRAFLQAGVGTLAGALYAQRTGAEPAGANDTLAAAELPAGTRASAQLYALPGKRPLIKKTFRPPNFETPTQYFNELYTPNDAFFVRYHLAHIPEQSAGQWRLKIGGEGIEKPYDLSLEDLKTQFEAVELPALCLCSGNRRGLFKPHVPGIEWGHGAMGNARWKGARLKDVLARANVGKLALEVAFDGADTAVVPATPDFLKSLPIWKAMDESTLIAYEMNGTPLPHWNGFPVRLVVPGWTATYWIKHLTNIDVLAKPLDNFWVKTAYRVPKGKFPIVDRFVSQETEVNTPITEMVVNSLITNIEEGARINAGSTIELRGIAWDGGYGITRVEISVDGGASWCAAQLETDAGRFSWRQWHAQVRADQAGALTLMARAANRPGATQTFDLVQNPAGYHHNVVQRLTVNVV